MEIKLNVSPLSVNKAWQGRRFKTDHYKQFEKDVCKLLPASKKIKNQKQEVFVHYVYHLHNYGNTDTANMEKCLTDILVKRGYIFDDRYIRAIYQRKERLDPNVREWVDIHIVPYDGQDIAGF